MLFLTYVTSYPYSIMWQYYIFVQLHRTGN